MCNSIALIYWRQIHGPVVVVGITFKTLIGITLDEKNDGKKVFVRRALLFSDVKYFPLSIVFCYIEREKNVALQKKM